MRKAYVHALFCGLFVVGMIVLCDPGAIAQANRATITGTVTDSTGAVVAGVEVTATNTGTNVPTKTVSNGNGIYVIPNLFPGQYSVEFKKDGFETLRRSAVTLESTEVARIDAPLKVGAVTQTMTVTTDAPVLDLERPSVGTNMKASVVNDMPLSIYGGGRFVENFAVAITPGYSPISSPYGAVVNGGQWFTKEYTVDGTSGTGDIPGNSMQNGPSMEAVQELQAQTSGLDSQSSITGGGVMSFNLKSGTNQFHGSVFGFGVNELLNANTWTNDYNHERKGKERAWDYGASVGGPIFKNKTFFFGTFERYVQNDFRLAGGSATVPTTDFMNGNFSALLGPTLCLDSNGNAGSCADITGGTPITVVNKAGQTIPAQEGMIFDPSTCDANTGLCQQFTGNVIPSSSISSVAQKINAIYQKHYVPQLGGLENNLRGLISNSPSQTPNEAVVKLDHILREQDRLSGSWIYNHKPRTLVDSGGLWEAGSTDGGPLSAVRLNAFRSHQWRATESHTFSPNVLNVLSFTYNMDWQGDQPAASGNWASQLGFGNTGASNFPLINFGSAESGQNGWNETFIGNTFQGNFSGTTIRTGDTVTWTKGRHNFSFGGDFAAHQVNSHAGSGALAFDFLNNTTGVPSQPYANFVGFGYASFLLGQVSNASETTPFNLYGRRKTMSLFAQDSYKVTPKLTLSLGLRWDYNFRFHEKYGHWDNFDLKAIDPVYGVPGTIVFAKNGGDSFEKNEYAKNFGPQIGFAYSPLPKTVFRGSFGMIYMPPGVAYSHGVPYGFAPGFQGTNTVSSAFDWDNGYPGVFKPGNTSYVDPTFQWNPAPVSIDPRSLRVGYSEAFNFGVQQELTRDMRLEISYVGNRGHRLTDSTLAWNEAPTSTFLNLSKSIPGLGGWYPYIYSAADAANYGVPYPYPGFYGPVLAAVAPYPQLAAAEANYWYYSNLLYVGLPLGQSFYDSMVVDLVKRTGRGLTMDLNYTWSRQEGDTWSSAQEGNGFYTPIQDFNNFRPAAHAVTGYDLPHVVKGYVNYQLPFGKGQRWNSGNRWLNAIVGGWTTSWLLTYYSGQPFEVGAANCCWPQWGSTYPNFNLAGYTGPNGTSKFVPLPSNYQGNPPPGNLYMPTSVASSPASGQLGQSGPSTSALRCPGSANENASLLKNVTMGSDGRYRLSFRTEFYNVFNRHYYYIQGCAGSRASIGSSDFGEIWGAFDNPRTGQFGVRFEF